MPGNEGWPVLAGQDLAQPGDVIGQPGHRELGCGDVVPVGLQALDDGAPTGAVGPGSVHKDDVGQRSHVWNARAWSAFRRPRGAGAGGGVMGGITARLFASVWALRASLKLSSPSTSMMAS